MEGILGTFHIRKYLPNMEGATMPWVYPPTLRARGITIAERCQKARQELLKMPPHGINI